MAVACALAWPAIASAQGMPDSAVTAPGLPVVVDVLANDALNGAVKYMRVTAPRHGAASVVGRQVRYVPAPGYSGPDTLSYAVVVGKRSIRQTLTIDVDASFGLTLAGQVSGTSAAGVEVTATLGNARFTATADSNGAYALPVAGAPDAMLRLSARGDAGRPGLLLRSTAAGFGTLRAQAGGDGTLTRDENNDVQVTPLSTARTLLLEFANGAAPIADDAELALASRHLDLFSLKQMAAAIKLAADGSYPLPAGTPDTYALIADRAAFEAYLDAVNTANPTAVESTARTLLGEPAVVAPLAAASVLGAHELVSVAGTVGAIDMSVIQGTRVVFAAGGSGEHVDIHPRPEPAMQWTLGQGKASVTLDGPVPVESFPSLPDIGQVRMLTTLTAFDVTRLFDAGDGMQTWGLVTYSTFTYPDNPEIPGGEQVASNLVLDIRDGAGELPYAAADFPSSRAMRLRPADAVDFTMVDAMLRFDAGGTGVRLDNGTSFAWTLAANGRLAVDYADGSRIAYRRVFGDGRGGEAVFADVTGSDGRRSYRWHLSMADDATGAFDVPTLAQSWRSGFFIGRPTVYPVDDLYYQLDDDADLGGTLIQISAMEPFISPIRWWVDGGTMLLRRAFDNSGWAPYCTIGVNGCRETERRRWRPVARDGARIYVVEEIARDLDNDMTVEPDELISVRANFYEVATPPAAR